jgi:hypothetical protein
MTRKSYHDSNYGGKREGAGRPRIKKGEKAKVKAFSLEERHVAMFEKWADRKGLKNKSAAMRELIEKLDDQE